MSLSIFTIGFTQTTASDFFESLKREDIRTLVDVRLNNVSQLSGFAKKGDLQYFVKEICGIDYIHEPILAPEQEMLDEYKKGKGSWDVYERKFLDLMYARRIEQSLSVDFFERSCLLCSEKLPHHCHRSLIAKYLQRHWNFEILVKHLV